MGEETRILELPTCKEVRILTKSYSLPSPTPNSTMGLDKRILSQANEKWVATDFSPAEYM